VSGFGDDHLVDDLGIVVKLHVKTSVHRRRNVQHVPREALRNLDCMLERGVVRHRIDEEEVRPRKVARAARPLLAFQLL